MTSTCILYTKIKYYVCYHLCVFMKSKGNLIMWSKFKCKTNKYILRHLTIPGYSNQMYLLLVLGYGSRFKVQGFFICHIINYTGYNQKGNVGQIRSAQWTVQRIKKNI